MTERGRAAVTRDATQRVIGPSVLEWIGGTLRLHLDEVSAPLPFRIRGTIDVETGPHPSQRRTLDAQARHRWGVIEPCARIAVDLDAPKLAWSASACLDTNRGDVPLERDFMRWNWSRAHLADGRTAVVYDLQRRHGGPLSIADWFDADGGSGTSEAPLIAKLPATHWGLRASTRLEASVASTVEQSFEDGPSYLRSVVSTNRLGQPVTGVHEHLSLERFERRWVRALLPFRMPRQIF